MPGSVYHQLTATTPDDPAYEIRPSHFNQSHLVTISATGSEIVGAFSNANGMSFGLSAGAVTGSYTVPSVPSVTEYFSRTNTTFNGANISGSITHNTNGLQLSLSAIAQSNQTGGVYHVGNTTGQSSSSTYDLRTLSIDGAGIVSAGWSAGSIRISATQSNQAFSAGAASSTFQTLIFQDSNGMSFSNNAGSIRASHNGLTSQSNQNVTAANGGFAFQTLSFSNLNGISFGTSAGSAITASHNALTTARASNDAIGLNTAQTNVTWTVNSSGLSLNAAGYAGTGTSATNASITLNSNGLAISVAAGGGVTPVASASNGSFSFTTLNFSNANNVTFGTSAGSIITASVAAPGAAAENNWIHLLGNNTAGNTTASGSTIGLSGVNLTLSGTNNSVVNIIGEPILSGWIPYGQADLQLVAEGNQSLYLAPHVLQRPMQCDRIIVPQFFTQATNSTLTASKTIYWGLFTKNESTLSLVWSASGSFSVNGSGTASSSANNGIRYVTLGHTTTVQPGNYWIGMVFRSSTAGANATFSMLGNFALNSTISGYLGVGSVTNNPLFPGLGVWTSTTSGMPGSVAFSQIRGNSSAFQRPPHLIFTSGTW